MGIRGTFRFHKVGQGLFYSGILNQKDRGSNSMFSFVYDCGSLSPRMFLDREIEDHRELLTKVDGHRKLDLLVVSHLHDDHVNGIDRLLKDVKVDTVVMPYASEGLSLLARLESRDEDSFLEAFYADPIGWFSGKGVRRLIMLNADMRELEGRIGMIERRPREDEEFGVRINYGENVWTEELDNTQVVYCGSHISVELCNFDWIFKFENLKPEGSKADECKTAVNTYAKESGSTLDKILKHKEHRSELRNRLKKIFDNALNRTSVVLKHGPTRDSRNTLFFYHSKWIYCGQCRMQAPPRRCTMHDTILTGDLTLTDEEDVELLAPKHPCKRCLVFQYPHHGSKDNCMGKFTRWISYRTVLSYGITNQYGHPHEEVEGQLRYVELVDERSSFDYQIVIKEDP